jgi:hypothetical protein
MPEPDDEQYFSRVEEHFGRRRGGPLVLSPNDWRLLEAWQQQRIPLPVVLRGINQAFDRFEASGPRPDRINSLRYCEQEVQAAWEDHRAAHRRPVGQEQEPNGVSTALPGASRHLQVVAAACRAAATEVEGGAAVCLSSAAASLDELEQQASAGTLDAREIDRRASELESRMRSDLTLLVEHAPALSDLSLPAFSPY